MMSAPPRTCAPTKHTHWRCRHHPHCNNSTNNSSSSKQIGAISLHRLHLYRISRLLCLHHPHYRCRHAHRYRHRRLPQLIGRTHQLPRHPLFHLSHPRHQQHDYQQRHRRPPPRVSHFYKQPPNCKKFSPITRPIIHRRRRNPATLQRVSQAAMSLPLRPSLVTMSISPHSTCPRRLKVLCLRDPDRHHHRPLYTSMHCDPYHRPRHNRRHQFEL